MLGFYRRTMCGIVGAGAGRSGAVTVVQRCSSDLRLNPHFHSIVLDGVFVPNDDGELEFHALPSFSNTDVAELLQTIRARVLAYLEKRGVIESRREPVLIDDGSADREPALAALPALAAAAVAGLAPAGPERRKRPSIALRDESGLRIASALSVAEAGFSWHAATTAPADDARGREALCKYVLRPPLAQERLRLLEEGLVRIELKRPFSTIAKSAARACGFARWSLLPRASIASSAISASPPSRRPFHLRVAWLGQVQVVPAGVNRSSTPMQLVNPQRGLRSANQFSFDVGQNQAGQTRVRIIYGTQEQSRLILRTYECAADLTGCAQAPWTVNLEAQQMTPSLRHFNGRWVATWWSHNLFFGADLVGTHAGILEEGPPPSLRTERLSFTFNPCDSRGTNYWGDYNELDAFGDGSFFAPFTVNGPTCRFQGARTGDMHIRGAIVTF